jgi:uncharacterized membrane protein YdjX (TVP38/TMEM64 family)
LNPVKVSDCFSPVPFNKKLVPGLRLAVIPLVVLCAVFAAWKMGYFRLDRGRQLVDAVVRIRSMPGSEFFYVGAFAIIIAFVLPAWIVTLVGGAIFGAWKGALLAWIGALAGTVLSHLLARHIAKAPMKRLFGDHRLLRRLREHDSVMELLRLRIMPVAPFAVLDYVAGVAGVSLRRLLLATMLGVIPSVVAYAFVGSELIRGIISRSDATRSALWIAGLVTVGMLMLSVTPALVRKFRE